MPSSEKDDELGQTAVTPVGMLDELPAGQLQMVVIGGESLIVHPLPDGATLTIGRSPKCDIVINDESISRRHAILKLSERITIEDQGSVNGTRVRGNELKPGHPIVITAGELVGLGTLSIILRHRVQRDRLRRLWTPDEFDARLEEECARDEHSRMAFALLRITTAVEAPDSYVSETVAEILRESDILSNYGPHEYRVLLIDTPPAKADEALRRMDARLVERGVGCTARVACCPRDGNRSKQLVNKVQMPATPEMKPMKGKPVVAANNIVVSDAQMQSLHRLVEQIAGSRIGVLLLGETGVGKEVFARAVHRASPRAAGPFVEVNCAALTETLLESELFGHEKGSFTNATATKPGLIEMANGGTLLLDEIGDMPLPTQAKLLRVIEESQLRRVGGLQPLSIDVRFVAATNRDLEANIASGTFRRDLLFRINGVTIMIPPLRERLAELKPMAEMFIQATCLADKRTPPTLTPEALELLTGYSWPGNVRELKHMIERALLLCGPGPIRPEHLPADKLQAIDVPAPSTEPMPLGETWLRPKGSKEEQQWIMKALEQARGNQTAAARLLGISRRTLVSRLNDYKLVHRAKKTESTD